MIAKHFPNQKRTSSVGTALWLVGTILGGWINAFSQNDTELRIENGMLRWPLSEAEFVVLASPSIEEPWAFLPEPIHQDGTGKWMNLAMTGQTRFFQLILGQQFSDDFADNLEGWQMVYLDPRFEPYTTLIITGRGTFRTEGGLCAECFSHAVMAHRPELLLGDFSARVDLVDWEPDSSYQVGLVGRGQLSSQPYGYIGGLSFRSSLPGSSSIWIHEESYGGVSELIALVYIDPPLDSAKDYRLTFSGSGPELEMELFELTDLMNPIATATAQDDTVPSGTVAIYSFANAEFDDFVATGTAP